MKRLIFNLKGSEKRAALLENDKLVEVKVRNPHYEEIVGNIYKGKVIDILPGMQAAFIDIGVGKNGFLHRDDLLSYQQSPLPPEEKKSKSISTFVTQGESIIVQVTKEATGPKGPKLTGIIEIAGNRLVYLPHANYIAVSRKMNSEMNRSKWRQFGTIYRKRDEGLLFRTSCELEREETVINELNELRTRYEKLIAIAETNKAPALLLSAFSFEKKLLKEMAPEKIDEIIVDELESLKGIKASLAAIGKEASVSLYQAKENIFSAYRIDYELERALKKVVWLENGAYIIIEKTEALTVIDVNTGKFQGKDSLSDTVLKTNLLAAVEIARQLRLREIGGIILIDFIDMKDEENQKRVIEAYINAAKNDPTRSRVMGFTKLGILEITRKKSRLSLQEALQDSCTACGGSGKTYSPDSVASQLERELLEMIGQEHEAIWIEANAEVQHSINGIDGVGISQLEKTLNFKLFFSTSYSYPYTYTIRHLGTIADVKSRMESSNVLK